MIGWLHTVVQMILKCEHIVDTDTDQLFGYLSSDLGLSSHRLLFLQIYQRTVLWFARMNSQLISTKHMYTALQLTCGSYDKVDGRVRIHIN